MKSSRRATSSGKPEPTDAFCSADAPESEGNTPISCGHERILPQWTWHYRILTQLRERLMPVSARPTPPAKTSAGVLPAERAEATGEDILLDFLWAKLKKETDPLFEVDSALERIREGTYGFCEETGHVIPAERLRATPWARLALAAS